MPCNLTSGYSLDCRDSIGGVKTIYITELANKSSITAASGTITAFTLTAGKKFWTYELMKETASLTENIVTSDTNGTVFYEQDLTFTIRKMQASLSQEIKLLAQNRLMIIVLDRNGKYFLLGQNNGAEMQASSAATGTAFGDMNGYTLAFKSKEESPANEVAANLIAGLTA